MISNSEIEIHVASRWLHYQESAHAVLGLPIVADE